MACWRHPLSPSARAQLYGYRSGLDHDHTDPNLAIVDPKPGTFKFGHGQKFRARAHWHADTGTAHNVLYTHARARAHTVVKASAGITLIAHMKMPRVMILRTTIASRVGTAVPTTWPAGSAASTGPLIGALALHAHQQQDALLHRQRAWLVACGALAL